MTLSRQTAEIALRALRWMEPADRAWAVMPKEPNAARTHAGLVAARMEIEDAIRGLPG